ncbi:putative Carbonic anhydrase IV protein [Naja naja]|nr:putative Carbonic anhydrase IV protein [Naja naja]
MENNGHTVIVKLDQSEKVELGGLNGRYKAVQFHFHWGSEVEKMQSPGSEHSIDGERYPMELHVVHIKEEFGNTESAIKGKALRLESLIPDKKDLTSFYRYTGSLTTPGCNEEVVWTLFENLGRIKGFWEKVYFDSEKKLPMVDNFRPVQPLGARIVEKSNSNLLLPPRKALLLVPTAALLAFMWIS